MQSSPSTVGGINNLEPCEKRKIYTRVIPPELLDRFQLSADLYAAGGDDLLHLVCPPGSSSVEMGLRHRPDFPDPVLYGHITDTISGQIHVLLYVLNDPASPRFDIDRLPDGTPTSFGTQSRNLEAELAALQFGLAPGQIRRGLRLLSSAIHAFEAFVAGLGHDLYFIEPLFYHNAIIFENYGFAYEKGRKLMERIQAGFTSDGDLLPYLDGSNPFRMPQASNSIRLRSWAIHDGLLGEPFTGITMYKRIGKQAGASTCLDCHW